MTHNVYITLHHLVQGVHTVYCIRMCVIQMMQCNVHIVCHGDTVTPSQLHQIDLNSDFIFGTYNYVSLSFVGFGNRKKKMKT